MAKTIKLQYLRRKMEACTGLVKIAMHPRPDPPNARIAGLFAEQAAHYGRKLLRAAEEWK